jgi:DNA-binding NtrC family response regulator
MSESAEAVQPKQKRPQVLVVDDDRASVEALAELLEHEGFEAQTAEGLEKARAALAEGGVDLVILDLQLPDGNGLELLDLLEEHPRTDVVIATAHASVDSAVNALRGGVVDYLRKPIDINRLRRILTSVRRTVALWNEVASLREDLRQLGRFGRMIGACPAMQEVYDLILRVAPTDTNVLIEGETGTGKELVAQTVHALSQRANHPLVVINCGAIAPSLMESELFGHERGSFTGASQMHRGLVECAHQGTLFLDEISEIPLDLQVKLLRAVETQSIRRVGGSQSIPANVRIVAATNRDLRQAVADGEFREDLMYRLLVFPIQLPPLRERPGDIELLAQSFLQNLGEQHGVRKRITSEALELLQQQAWPGNVREFQNVLERAYIMAADEIDIQSLPFGRIAGVALTTSALEVRVGMSLQEVERKLTLATLTHFDGDKPKAAEVLGISLKTLYNRLKQYETEEPA